MTIEDFLMYRHGMDCENNNPESNGSEQKMMESDLARTNNEQLVSVDLKGGIKFWDLE